MRTLIAMILLATAFTACGNKNKSNGNGITREGAFLECSYSQVRVQCLDYASDKRILPRFFYYRQCYVEYNSCLKGFGY
jgi:hypothetical protein